MAEARGEKRNLLNGSAEALAWIGRTSFLLDDQRCAQKRRRLKGKVVY